MLDFGKHYGTSASPVALDFAQSRHHHRTPPAAPGPLPPRHHYNSPAPAPPHCRHNLVCVSWRYAEESHHFVCVYFLPSLQSAEDPRRVLRIRPNDFDLLQFFLVFTNLGAVGSGAVRPSKCPQIGDRGPGPAPKPFISHDAKPDPESRKT